MSREPSLRSLKAFARAVKTMAEHPNLGLIIEAHSTLTTREQRALNARLIKLGYMGVLVQRKRTGPGRPRKWTDERLAGLLAGQDGEDLTPSTRRRLAVEAKRRLRK
jgi:hypothetical protein